MKRKDLQKLAKKILEQELILDKATSEEEKTNAEKEIIRLSSFVNSLEDMLALDEAIQNLLSKNS